MLLLVDSGFYLSKLVESMIYLMEIYLDQLFAHFRSKKKKKKKSFIFRIDVFGKIIILSFLCVCTQVCECAIRKIIHLESKTKYFLETHKLSAG